MTAHPIHDVAHHNRLPSLGGAKPTFVGGSLHGSRVTDPLDGSLTVFTKRSQHPER